MHNGLAQTSESGLLGIVHAWQVKCAGKLYNTCNIVSSIGLLTSLILGTQWRQNMDSMPNIALYPWHVLPCQSIGHTQTCLWPHFGPARQNSTRFVHLLDKFDIWHLSVTLSPMVPRYFGRSYSSYTESYIRHVIVEAKIQIRGIPSVLTRIVWVVRHFHRVDLHNAQWFHMTVLHGDQNLRPRCQLQDKPWCAASASCLSVGLPRCENTQCMAGKTCQPGTSNRAKCLYYGNLFG